MGKDYVAALKQVEKSREFREGYHAKRENLKAVDDSDETLSKDQFRTGIEKTEINRARKYVEKNSRLHTYGKGEFLKLAHDLMWRGIKTGDLGLSYLAAQVYDKLGLGDKESVQRRLVEAAQRSKPDSYSQYIKKVETFLTNHQQQGNLEQRVAQTKPMAIATGFVLLVSFLSSQASVTGFAVQQSTSSLSSGWASIFFFAFIIITVFYLFHKK